MNVRMSVSQQSRICTKSLWICLSDLCLVLHPQGAVLIQSRINDCALRVPNKTTTLFLLWAIIKAICIQSRFKCIVSKSWQLVLFFTCRILPLGLRFVVNFPLRIYVYFIKISKRKKEQCIYVYMYEYIPRSYMIFSDWSITWAAIELGTARQTRKIVICRSQVRFRPKNENSNPHGFEITDLQARVLNYCFQ